MRPINPVALLATLVGTSGAFALLARAVKAKYLKPVDGPLRQQVQEDRSRSLDPVAEALGPIGKDWLLGPLAVVIAGVLWHQRSAARSAVPVAAAVIASAGAHLCDYVLAVQHPPPGHPTRDEESFPSGHAFQTSAVALTTAYVVAREDLVDARSAFAVAAALSIISPGGRVYLDRHWMSDVVGGWLLGVATATVCAAAYDALPAAERSTAAEVATASSEPRGFRTADHERLPE